MIKIQKNLYVGNMEDAIQASKTKSVDAIVYVGQELPEELAFIHNIPVVHIPLNDGSNSKLNIEIVCVNIAYFVLEDKTLIACRAGISRSPMMIVAYLAGWFYSPRTKNRFEKAYIKVSKLVPMFQPAPDLVKSVKEVLKSNGKTTKNLDS